MQIDVPSSHADPRFLGIDIGGTKIHAIATDGSFREVADRTEPTQGDVLGQVRRLCDEMGRGALAGVGIGVPGAVDPLTGVISKAPNVAALEGIDLASELRSSMGVPVVVENDLVAAARAEARPTVDPDELVAVIAAGTGIGMGIVRGGGLLRGAHGAAGEIADIPFSDQTVLEDHVSSSGMMTAYRSAGGSHEHSVPDILRRARAGDAAAGTALAQYAAGLGRAIRIVVAVLDPARIILTGGLGSHPIVLAAIAPILGDDLRALVTPSEFGADSPVRGAVLLAHDAALVHPAGVH